MRTRLRRVDAAVTCWLKQEWPWLRWLLVLALAAVVVAVLGPLPAWLTRHPSHGLSPDQRLKATNDVRTTLVQALGGLALLGGLFFTSRTFRLTREGQLTDRYTKAIEQLGSETLDVRLGGIYALERLARDSKDDQQTIVEVLSAFVRLHSNPVHRWRRHQTEPGYKETGYKERGEQELTWNQERQDARKHVAVYPLPVDVQDAVTVLGRLPCHKKVPRAELSGAYLRDAKLSNAKLFDLSEADLSEADLSKADVTGANVTGMVWSYPTTKWPSEELREFLCSKSSEIEPEIKRKIEQKTLVVRHDAGTVILPAIR